MERDETLPTRTSQPVATEKVTSPHTKTNESPRDADQLDTDLHHHAQDDARRRADELTALQAICTPDEITVHSPDRHWALHIRKPPATLHLFLPKDYPSRQPPTPFLRATDVSDDECAAIAAELIQIFNHTSGDESAYLWLEHARERLLAARPERPPSPPQPPAEAAAPIAAPAAAARFTFTPQTGQFHQPTRHFGADAHDEANAVHLVHGEPFTPPGNSTFQAHYACVASIGQVRWALRELLQDKKVARAAHNIFAYRFVDSERGGVQISDNDDDGEAAAGGRLAALLELMGARNVLVVVTRWFGGTLLGPARFKYITNAARELIVQCNDLQQQGLQPGESPSASKRRPGKRR